MNKALLFLLLTPVFSNAQLVDWKKVNNEIEISNKILNRSARTKVLLLGTFHFDFPNRDSHKIDSSQMFDILSKKRQKEVLQLVDVLRTYKPTKIYLESLNQNLIDSLYQSFLHGSYELERSEKFQVGFRLAKDLQLKKLYAVDDQNWILENYKQYTWIDSLWSAAVVSNVSKADKWNKAYGSYYRYQDSLRIKQTILEGLLYLSSQTVLNQALGNYFVGGFNTVDDKGPDRVAMQWYSRNLRIFKNILNSDPKPEDRILVIYGNGHMPILKHLFQSSPEFEIQELKALVQKTEKGK